MVRTQVRVAAVDGWIEGNILYLLCGLLLSYCSWVSFMIQRFSADGNRTWPLWRAPPPPHPRARFYIKSNMHEAVTGQVRTSLYLLSERKHLGLGLSPRNGRKAHSGRFVVTILTYKDTQHIITGTKSRYSDFVRMPTGNSNDFSLCLSKDGFSKYKCCR